MSINEVREIAENMLSSKTNDMTKIKIKCWLYHSESRTKNNNEPFTFDNYSHALGKQTYLDYIKFNLIDCNEIGGNEKAIQVVENWFS
jgi:hypothetical protein